MCFDRAAFARLDLVCLLVPLFAEELLRRVPDSRATRLLAATQTMAETARASLIILIASKNRLSEALRLWDACRLSHPQPLPSGEMRSIPAAIGLRGILEPVVQPVGAALPELDDPAAGLALCSLAQSLVRERMA